MSEHEPLHPLVLDAMHEHPERFGHMDKTEYFRLLIEDIRYYCARLEEAKHLTLTAVENWNSASTEAVKRQLAIRLIEAAHPRVWIQMPGQEPSHGHCQTCLPVRPWPCPTMEAIEEFLP